MTRSAIAGSVRDALDSATDALAAVGVETPRFDAEVLLAEATGRGRAALVADPAAEVTAADGRRFGEMVRRRLRREPVAYILGRKGFRSCELAVDRRVLVPRPETELMVELAVEHKPRRLLDVGTGSGAIALAVAGEVPDCEVVATDTSAAALEVARANATSLGLADRVEWIEGTLPPPRNERAGGSPEADSQFDLVLANLPYVAERDWASLQPEVREWEPREALLAGPDGLDAIRSLLARVRRPDRHASEMTKVEVGERSLGAGVVALEVGAGQADTVGELVREAGFALVETRRDLAGIERVVVGR
jgi:release factor glutamine methyltransferase